MKEDTDILEQLEAESRDAPFSRMVAYLSEVIDRPLTASVSLTDDLSAVDAWAQGEQLPTREDVIDRIRCAYQTVRLLREYYQPEDVREWWRSDNRRLGWETPASALRAAWGPEQRRAVLWAAWLNLQGEGHNPVTPSSGQASV